MSQVAFQSHIPTIRSVTASKGYVVPLDNRVEGLREVLLGQKQGCEDPALVGEVFKAGIEGNADTILGTRLVTNFLASGWESLAESPAIGSMTVSMLQGAISMEQSLRGMKLSDLAGDKTGSRQARFGVLQASNLVVSNAGFAFSRYLRITSTYFGIEIGAGSPSLLGRAAFWLGTASTILLLGYLVGCLAMTVWSISNRNSLLHKIHNDEFGNQRTLHEKYNYLRHRFLVFDDPWNSTQNSIDCYAHIPKDGTERFPAHVASYKAILKYDQYCIHASLLERAKAGREFAIENLHSILKAMPKDFCEMQKLSKKEIGKIIDNYVDAEVGRGIPGIVTRDQFYSDVLGKLAFFSRLEIKKNLKMERSLRLSEREFGEIKAALSDPFVNLDLTNPYLTKENREAIVQARESVVNLVAAKLKRETRIDGLRATLLLLGIVGIVLSMIFTGGTGLFVALGLSIVFLLACFSWTSTTFIKPIKREIWENTMKKSPFYA